MTIPNTKIAAIQALQLHLRQRTIDAIADANDKNVTLSDKQLRLIIETEKELCNQLLHIEIQKDYYKTIKRFALITIVLATLIVMHAIQSTSLSKAQYIREAISMVAVYMGAVLIYYRNKLMT